jgi:hypothetical protein
MGLVIRRQNSRPSLRDSFRETLTPLLELPLESGRRIDRNRSISKLLINRLVRQAWPSPSSPVHSLEPTFVTRQQLLKNSVADAVRKVIPLYGHVGKVDDSDPGL